MMSKAADQKSGPCPLFPAPRGYVAFRRKRAISRKAVNDCVPPETGHSVGLKFHYRFALRVFLASLPVCAGNADFIRFQCERLVDLTVPIPLFSRRLESKIQRWLKALIRKRSKQKPHFPLGRDSSFRLLLALTEGGPETSELRMSGRWSAWPHRFRTRESFSPFSC